MRFAILYCVGVFKFWHLKGSLIMEWFYHHSSFYKTTSSCISKDNEYLCLYLKATYYTVWYQSGATNKHSSSCHHGYIIGFELNVYASWASDFDVNYFLCTSYVHPERECVSGWNYGVMVYTIPFISILYTVLSSKSIFSTWSVDKISCESYCTVFLGSKLFSFV